MPRVQLTLHEAMRTILLDHPKRIATLQVLSEENAQRDLYRQRKGDGPHPPPHQLRIRARKYSMWFDLLPPNRIQYIGS